MVNDYVRLHVQPIKYTHTRNTRISGFLHIYSRQPDNVKSHIVIHP